LEFYKQGSSHPYNYITVNSITATSDTSLTANISIGKYATKGWYDVAVTNSENGTAKRSSAFIVNTSTAAIKIVNPSQGIKGETMNIVISGTDCDFDQGSNMVFLKGYDLAITADSVIVQNANTLQASIT